MISKVDKNQERLRRHKRVRKNISGTAETPRLCVYRSLVNIYAQIIDDTKGVTLVACSTMEKELAGLEIAQWHKPNGGYFISLDVYPGCAKKVHALLKDAGVVMTGAGATFPYGNDPKDRNLRIAPRLYLKL